MGAPAAACRGAVVKCQAGPTVVISWCIVEPGRADLLIIKVPRLDTDSCTGPQLSCGPASCQDGKPAARVAVTDARPLCMQPPPPHPPLLCAVCEAEPS